MNHAELHASVRELLNRKGMRRAFSVRASSTEFHPGRVIVQWVIDVMASADGASPIFARSVYPETALRQIEDLLSEDQLPGVEPLDTIGEAPCSI